MKYSFRYFLKTTRDILLKFYGLFEIRIRIKFDFLFVLRLRLRSCHSLRPNYLLLSVFSFVYKYLYNCQIEGSRIISWDVLLFTSTVCQKIRLQSIDTIQGVTLIFIIKNTGFCNSLFWFLLTKPGIFFENLQYRPGISVTR